MTQDQRDSLRAVFNKAVSRFWEAADAYEAERGNDAIRAQLLDAADAVLFARDDWGGAGLAADSDDVGRDNVARDVEDMTHYLHKNEIYLTGAPQVMSTGRKTYRVLNKRFE